MFTIESKATLKTIQILNKIANDKTNKGKQLYQVINFNNGTATVTNGRMFVSVKTDLEISGNYTLSGNILVEKKQDFPDFERCKHNNSGEFWTGTEITLDSDTFISRLSVITGKLFSRKNIVASEIEKLIDIYGDNGTCTVSYTNENKNINWFYSVQIQNDSLFIVLMAREF